MSGAYHKQHVKDFLCESMKLKSMKQCRCVRDEKSHFFVLLQVGWDTLHEEFSQLLLGGNNSKKHKGNDEDDIFNKLKMSVIETSKTKHQWESKAEDSLVSCYYLEVCHRNVNSNLGKKFVS